MSEKITSELCNIITDLERTSTKKLQKKDLVFEKLKPLKSLLGIYITQTNGQKHDCAKYLRDDIINYMQDNYKKPKVGVNGINNLKRKSVSFRTNYLKNSTPNFSN